MPGILLGGWLAAMVAVLGTDATCTSCPQGWTYYEHSCYIQFTRLYERVPWIEAYQQCVSLNAQLLVVSSKEETDFIRELIQQAADKKFWLGCKERDGRWLCSDEKQQQLAMLNNEWKCTTVTPSSSSFSEIDCVREKRFVCEQKFSYAVRCQAVSKQDAGLMTTPYCLLDHAYMVTQIKHPIQCCMACYKDPNCLSFNLSGKMCHLNNVSISQLDDNSVATCNLESSANYRLDTI